MVQLRRRLSAWARRHGRRRHRLSALRGDVR
jgi:hypothetical protein